MHVVILDDQYGPLFRDVSEFLGPWISGCDLVFACVGIFISIIMIRYYKSLLHSFTAAISIATQGVLQPFGRFGTAIFVVLITVFCCPFLLQFISVAGSFLYVGFIGDGPAAFAKWGQANWPWLVYNKDMRYVAVSTYMLPLPIYGCFQK